MRLSNSDHNGISMSPHTILMDVWNIHFSILAELPITQEFFEQFLHVAQNEEEDSNEQDMEPEAQNISSVLTQPSNHNVTLGYDNPQADVPQLLEQLV